MNKESKKEVMTGKLEIAEAVARSCSAKNVFLIILQNSHENTCVRTTFLTLIWVRGAILPPPPLPHLSWFSLNNSETIKAATLACAAFSNISLGKYPPNFQSPDIEQNSDGGISDFQISRQSLIKVNSHNSRISDDIDIKLGPVTKLENRNKITSKKIGDDLMLANCDASLIFSIHGQFGAIRKADFGRIVCKTYILINSNLLFYKI